MGSYYVIFSGGTQPIQEIPLTNADTLNKDKHTERQPNVNTKPEQSLKP